MIAEQFGRLKGAEWFEYAHERDVLLLGAGGISSNLAHCLARIGCNLHIFDHDDVEAINLAGQLYKRSDIGTNKAVAVKNNISLFSPATQVFTYGKYEAHSMSNEIVLCGFDNMLARKIAFDNWVKYINTPGIDKSKCYFSDGRLTANLVQVYSIPGDKQDLIDKYYSEALFDDSEVPELDCSFKQTTHVAFLIAGFMTSFFTNWLANVYTDVGCNKVPFFFQYFTSLNLVQNEVN
jgi:molybdopterin/thiamine biosynthesis adenylyltransferase